MSELYLVRHAQASFGEDDYDRLSLLGHQQARWLGEYFQFRNMQFDQVICGDMVRHRETLAGIASGMGQGTNDFETHPQWNEFDFEALVETYLARFPDEVPAANAPRHALFQVLRKALHAWADDQLGDRVPESWASFEQRVQEALSLVTGAAQNHRKVLVISSGGAISMAIRHILQAPPTAMVQMNLQTRNSSFSHFFFNQRDIFLSGFNHVPHLDHPDRSDAVTYY
jgi:broad specificity phosphatase PhoE